MKRCLECQSEDVRAGHVPVTYTLPTRTGDRTFEGSVQGTACKGCGATSYDGPDLGRFERLVALQLLRLGISTGAEVRFLRKQAGLKAAELAAHLGVSPETVSHWETGKTHPDPSTLAMIVQLSRAEFERDEPTKKILGPALAPKDLLERVRGPQVLRTVRVGSTSVLAA